MSLLMFFLNPMRPFKEIYGRILVFKFDFVLGVFFIELFVNSICRGGIENHDVFRMSFLQVVKFMMELVVLVVRIGGGRV